MPLFDYIGERDNLEKSYRIRFKNPEKVREYWQTANERSIDGIASGLAGKNHVELGVKFCSSQLTDHLLPRLLCFSARSSYRVLRYSPSLA